MEQTKKKFGLKRILSVVLCLSMLLSPIVALAEGEMLAADEPTSITIQESKTDTVYKLVENYTAADISTSKTYMIVSTDIPGAASALGAKDNSDSFMQTRHDLKVFEVPVTTDSLSAGKYVTNTFSTPANGEWKFESAGSGRYYLYTTSTLGDAFLCTHCNGGTGGYHSGHMMLISRQNAVTNKWTRTCKFAIATDKVDLGGLNTVYPSATSEKPGGVTAGEDGYLSYGEYDGYYDNVNKGKFTDFNIVTSGSAKTRVQLYEKVGSRAIPEIKGYLYSKNGTVAVNTGDFAPTGAYIHLYVDGELTRVPVTTDMLSGADLTKAGTYNNVKVSYNGVQLADDFTLVVKAVKELVVNNYNEAGKNSSFFVLADPDQNNSFVEGGYIHIAETQTPGYVRLLTTDGTNLGSTEYYAYEIFVNGERQLVIDAASANSIWVTNSVKHDSLPDGTKCWNLRAFFYGEKYLNFNGSADLGQDGALTVNTVKNDWTAKWHERNEMTGIALYNPDGSIETSESNKDVQKRNYKWRTMYYNYMIGTFGLRLEQADGNAAGYKPSNQNINELREPQPQDRAYFYTRTSEYANATVYLTKNSGTVSYGATGADSPSGVYLVMTVTDAYGVSHVTNIPVTLDMLTYNDDNVKTKTATDSDKVYSDVKVTYQGVTISSSFKLTVKQKLPENDYPAYPAPGSVDITKELNKEEYNYLETGLTEVNLSLTGIPDASGADVVLVLDNSGSMAYSADPNSAPMPNNSKARRNEMVASIKTMLKKFAETIDGYKSDISVSILTFDGYTLIDGGMFIKKTDGTQSTLATTHNQADTAHFLTPSESLATLPSIENRFIHSSKLTDEKINEIANSFGMAYSGSGTNYDQGLHLAYETLAGKQKLNAQAGTKRNPFLIFMSDGCTWQYNYVGGGSEGKTGEIGGYSTWNDYLNGNLSAIPAKSRPSNTARYEAFANSAGRHWMAEAIKGDTDERYKIINPSGNPENNYVEWVNGLGAEVFVVGFGMATDNAISRETAVGVLERISSGVIKYTKDDVDGVNVKEEDIGKVKYSYFYDVAKSGQINEVFEEVAMKIRAASGAVFEDQMGKAFDLQMASTIAGPRGPITLNPAPSVEVYEYITYRADQVGTVVNNVLVTEEMIGKDIPTLYTSADIGTTIGGVKVTEEMIGTEKLPYTRTLIEQITFNGEGTAAYSSLVVDENGVKTDILGEDGIIDAVTFRYNTKKDDPKTPDNVENIIKIDSNADGVLDYDLPPETFAWLVGDIPQSRYELHYDVYLEGSMQGEAEAGEGLLTNEYAVLKYKNYISHDCSIEAPKPNLPWNKAQVTTGYYLVNGKGQPIDANGNITTFDKAVRIDALSNATQRFNLNSTKTIDGDGEGQIPDAYQLYESDAAYSVLAQSVSATRGKWTSIGDTTYVESGSLTGESATREDLVDASKADYTNTKVWFALVPKVCMDDTVVIDYGIPVDVDVIKNDDFKEDNGKATLTGYAPKVDEDPTYFDLTSETPTGFINIKDEAVTNKTLNGKFGKFTANENLIRYELNEMQMSGIDTLTYGTQYSGDKMVKGKYYGNLTVIPATIIYYEDDFVSLTVHDYNTGAVKAENWTTVGTEKNNVQRDDRVGEKLANVYGQDAAYADSSTYSFGSAQKVHIARTDVYDSEGKVESSSGEYAKATFTFAGTGFDIISYTTNKTGTILVQVFPYESLDATEASSKALKSIMVDTYYGYKHVKVLKLDNNGNQIFENGKPLYEYRWVPAAGGEEAGLYQVPVMKIKDLDYGKYKVVVTASYNFIFDHGQYGEKPDRFLKDTTRTGEYDFYLDAIRIYDPANDGADNDVIKNAYITDGEYMPEYKELRNILINDVKGFAVSGSNVEGAVFIDNAPDSEKQTYTISEYKSYGPNNELYLGKGQAVAFAVNTKGCDSVHIAAKMDNGTGKLMITNVKYNLSLELPIDLMTATDMYYDLSGVLVKDATDNIIVLRNTDGNGIISITNLKFTKTATVSTEMKTASAVYMNAKAANAAVDYLNALDAEPEVYSIKTLKRTVKAGRAFTMTVTTNCDADYIVVNGVTFTKYIENRFKNQRTWIVTLTLEEKGMAQIDAYAYSTADVASEKMTTTVKVTKTSAFEGIFGGLFGGIFSK